ncbi:hypothetical protein DICPUDRAFT_84563 [Dictyostelium purpureum]|uniref:FAD dependent oxidoreductase domain-containing protein n=1 Tax=Dictyostelium purpureum TaxID=5786 RepID=F1A315_DICPU|nr:uncharacterized protein DICPUDRAFT_84563 [Dictyostelium purpureum]EGC29421.1 hypothetical protein DICPUDRAFT_84563 [Dictyostelium purpureum]|eukprot:XP_003294059.1 hypothetical protein DICPUDRAFT_84563 [Dictyostelium purpureum]
MGSNDNKIFDSIIIGGGIAGSLCALKISNNKKVLLLEKEGEILPKSGSSYSGCYKIHTGLHFLKDLETAKLCLYKGIQFVKEFSLFLLGGKDGYHLKKSRFFLMSNSAVTIEEAVNNTNSLVQYYKELVCSDPSNKVLGEVNGFIKIIPKSQYMHYIAEEIPFINENEQLVNAKVSLCFEYSEFILDFEKLKKSIIDQIQTSENIILKLNYNVDTIKNIQENNNYLVCSDKDCSSFIGKSIINCSFESIEMLDKQIFSIENSNNCFLRIKCGIVIQIPDTMKEWMSSFLFGIGPFCGFLVNQDNKVVLVSERSSNIGFFSPNEPIPNDIKDSINNCNLSNKYGMDLANSILKECAEYIKEPYRSDILKSEILELKKGYVKIYQENYTKKSLYNVNSGVHKRLEEIKIRKENYYSNCSTKMTYSLDDSNTVVNYINGYLKNN